MATIPGLSTLASPASSALFWIYDATATPADRSHSIASLAARVKRLNREYKVNTAGGAISLSAFETENLILTYNGASVVTLPQASTCIGYKVRIIAAYPGAALVTITPHTDDHIELQAANVSIFLNNSDGSANVSKFQHVDLIAVASGYWAVIGGNYCPDQSVDTDGSHIVLGNLHRLPLNNETSRGPSAIQSPNQGEWSEAITIAGSYGVPAKSRGIRARIRLFSKGGPTAGANTALRLFFSDNNSDIPSLDTSHPGVELSFYTPAVSATMASSFEVDIPLNSSGQFYAYTRTAIGLAADIGTFQICVLGYYMGD